MSQWFFGALMAILSLLGLFLASRAEDGMFAAFGFLLFLFGLVIVVVLVHRATEAPSSHELASHGSSS